jgi:hypothetical protein
MPNHVYHHIIFNTTLSSKQKEILKEIEQNDRGICGHYHPMPEDIRMTYMSYKNCIRDRIQKDYEGE